jgi:hypothetical protein
MHSTDFLHLHGTRGRLSVLVIEAMDEHRMHERSDTEVCRSMILKAVSELEELGIGPADIADTLLILGANAVAGLVGPEETADLLAAMSEEIRDLER